MAVSFTQSVRVKEDILISGLENESVILNLDSERYFGLDATGTDILATLTKSSSIEEAFHQLANEYEVDEATLRQDLASFIEQLVAQGLVQVK
jgi:hypothetical protein